MKIEELPHWIRWLLVPTAAVFAYIFVNVFFGSIWILQEWLWKIGSETFFRRVVENLIQTSASGFLVVTIAAYVSPSKKVGVALIFGVLMLIIGGLAMLSAIEAGQAWRAINSATTGLGAGVGVLNEFRNRSMLSKLANAESGRPTH